MESTTKKSTTNSLIESTTNGSMKSTTNVVDSLSVEATILEPILSYCYSLYKQHILKDYDFVGIFILAYLGIRKPKSWLNTKLKTSIFQEILLENMNNGHENGHENIQFDEYKSIEIKRIPGLLDLLNPIYLQKKLNCIDVENITIISFYNNYRFTGIKKNINDYINKNLVSWACGKQPFVLMFTIPTPYEVLQQQANKKRVVTMFITYEKLSKCHQAMLYYMDGMHNHEKDSFEFLLHDIKHMDNFMDSNIHLEQVGFFQCMLNLSDNACKILKKEEGEGEKYYYDDNNNKDGEEEVHDNNNSDESINTNEIIHLPSSTKIRQNLKPKYFFTTICKYDNILWQQLEYVISDM